MVDEGILETADFKFSRTKVYAHKKLKELMFGGR
jgi:hypothetical protein